MSYISEKALIEPNVYIGRNVTILAGVHVKSGTIIEDNCILGKPSRVQLERFRRLMDEKAGPLPYSDYESVIDTPTIIGEDCQLQAGCIIYSGVQFAEHVVCEDNGIVRWDTKVGAYSKIMIGVMIASYVTIGQYCRIGGICCNDAYIGNYVTSFGTLMHSYKKYGGGRRDPAPHLEDHVTVGYGANVVGGIVIGERSYVAAGSTINKDVPPHYVVTGINVMQSMEEWKGELKKEYPVSFPFPKEWLIDPQEKI